MVPLYFRVATLLKNKKIISFFANIHQNCNMAKYKNDLVRIICNDGKYIDGFEDISFVVFTDAKLCVNPKSPCMLAHKILIWAHKITHIK